MKKIKQSADFGNKLKRALAKAPHVELTNKNKGTVIDGAWRRPNQASHPYSKLKDSEEIDFGIYEKIPHEIVTKDFEEFLDLLKQTLRVLDQANSVKPYKEEDVEYYAQLSFIHEMEHSNALYDAGVRNAVIYGVSIFKTMVDGKEMYGHYAFMKPEGKITKIAAAKMFAGPSRLSESDLQKILDLGYDSPDKLRKTGK